MHPDTIESRQCCWCGALGQATGAELTRRGWRSATIHIAYVDTTQFYCPVCYPADDIEPLIVQGSQGTGMRVADILESLGGRREDAAKVLAAVRRAA